MSVWTELQAAVLILRDFVEENKAIFDMRQTLQNKADTAYHRHNIDGIHFCPRCKEVSVSPVVEAKCHFFPDDPEYEILKPLAQETMCWDCMY